MYNELAIAIIKEAVRDLKKTYRWKPPTTKTKELERVLVWKYFSKVIGLNFYAIV